MENLLITQPLNTFQGCAKVIAWACWSLFVFKTIYVYIFQGCANHYLFRHLCFLTYEFRGSDSTLKYPRSSKTLSLLGKQGGKLCSSRCQSKFVCPSVNWCNQKVTEPKQCLFITENMLLVMTINLRVPQQPKCRHALWDPAGPGWKHPLRAQLEITNNKASSFRGSWSVMLLPCF